MKKSRQSRFLSFYGSIFCFCQRDIYSFVTENVRMHITPSFLFVYRLLMLPAALSTCSHTTSGPNSMSLSLKTSSQQLTNCSIFSFTTASRSSPKCPCLLSLFRCVLSSTKSSLVLRRIQQRRSWVGKVTLVPDQLSRQGVSCYAVLASFLPLDVFVAISSFLFVL